MVKFLHDAPADKDFFGPHSAIAKAILETVCVDHKLRIIGLSGSWGSGKSTVIRQLAKHLADDTRCKNYLFFEYDAWLTQNDPPRRSFMEALIPFLTEKKVLEASEWDRRLDILKGKVQESTKTTTPILTWKSVVFLKTYILLAVGLFLLNKVDIKNTFSSKAADIDIWILVSSIGLIAIAPLAMAAIFIRERFIEKLPPEQRSVVPRLLNKSVDTNRETTTRLLEPTSIEFRDEFREIMAQVAVKRLRLMIVLDNVDRLSDEEALSLWSTMRSFFVDRLGQDFSSTDAPIVIVPVDIGSLTRVFVKDRDEAGHGREVAQSYIDKTFDVLFDVKEPTISDWRSYFEEAFKEAVGDIYNAWDIHQARRLYEFNALREKRKTTPRAVIRLANSAAAIVATLNEIAPLPTIVLYVLNKEEIGKGISKWVTSEGRDFSDFDADWKLNLASLYFMTDKNKAVGPLLKDDIALAIIEEAPERVEKYLDIQGLGDVIAELAHDPPIESAGALTLGSLAAIASLMQDYGSKIHGSALWLGEAQGSFKKSFLKLDPAQPDLSKLGCTLRFLCSLDNECDAYLSLAIGMIQTRLSEPKMDTAGLDIIAEILDEVQRLALDRKQAKLEIVLEGDTALQLTRQFAIYRRSKNWDCIKGPTDQTKIEEELAKRLNDPIASMFVADQLKMLSLQEEQRLSFSTEVEEHPLLVAIGKVLEDEEKSQFVAAAAESMTELILDDLKLASIVEQWSADGELSARFQAALTDEDPRRIWALISLGVASATYFTVVKPDAWPEKIKNGNGIARALLLLAKRPPAERVDLVWRAIREWPPVIALLYNLRDALIGKMTSDDLDAPALLKDYENTILKAGRAPFLNFLVGAVKAEATLSELPPSALVQMLALPNVSSATRRVVVNALTERIHSASADEWSIWILEGSTLFSHWSEVKTTSPARLGKRSGLAAGLIGCAAASVSDAGTLKRWRHALDLGNASVVQDAKTALLREVSAILDTRRAVSILKLIDVPDSVINALDAQWSHFLARLMTHEEGREWIDGHASAISRFVRSLPTSDATRLRTVVEGLSSSKREGRRLWAQRAQVDWFGGK